MCKSSCKIENIECILMLQIFLHQNEGKVSCVIKLIIRNNICSEKVADQCHTLYTL